MSYHEYFDRIAHALERIAAALEAKPSATSVNWQVCAHEWHITTSGTTCVRCGARQ